MGKHQKRIAAPRSWRIERKTAYWAVKPRPGPHQGNMSMPLLLIVRDVLKLADNSKEAKRILHEGNILIDGKPRKDHKFPIGIFDIISIPAIDANYMVVLNHKGKLSLVALGAEAESGKLCRVNNKTMIKGGQIQLNLYDGRNVIPSSDLGAEIKTHDSVMISLDTNEILQKFAYKEGSKVMVIGGKHSAQTGEIEEIRTVRSPESNVVKIKPLEGGDSFETIEEYVFVVGEENVEIPGFRNS